MKLAWKLFAIVITSTLALTACVQQETKPEPPPPEPVVVEPSYQAQLGITDKERFLLAIKFLEQGAPEEARIELTEYLLSKPDNKRAKNLIKQIDTPAAEYFPNKSYKVTMRPGESLSTLARDHLGDLFQFYALAKFNNITEPSKMVAGQTIQIPKLKGRTIPKPQPKAPDDEPITDEDVIAESESEPETIVEEVTEEETVSADEEVANQETVTEEPSPPAEPNRNDLLFSFYSALEAQDFVDAADQLTALSDMQAMTPDAKKKAADVYLLAAENTEGSDTSKASDYYHKAAQHLLNSGKSEQALSALEKSVATNPNNRSANNQYKSLQKQLSDEYHRQANKAYRQQELDKAIALWDKTLEIDPNHTQAKALRAQAIELQGKLNKLKN